MENLTNNLNDIFNDSDIKITDMLNKLNVKNRKITFSDALIYKFKYYDNIYKKVYNILSIKNIQHVKLIIIN